MESQNKDIQRLLELQKDSSLMKSSLSLLHWDQETYMPEQAIEWRSEQIAQLSGLIHDRDTSPEIKKLFHALNISDKDSQGDGSTETEKALLQKSWREYRQSVCFPREYVVEKSSVISQAHGAWIKAREQNDFSLFQPWLEKVVDFARKDAEYLGYEDHPYDALVDLYEPQMTHQRLQSLFDPLAEELSVLVQDIAHAPQVDNSFLKEPVSVDLQQKISEMIMTDMGYDLSMGRLDVSAHPFTIELGPKDVRITTRYDENCFDLSLYGTIHEAGHALYELGVKEEIAGTLLGEGVSLGIHESQSRYWENLIGRSKAFCSHYLPLFQKEIPRVFDHVDVDQFYRAVNRVEPSYIRIMADEVTYSLHIILRYRLEVALLEGQLQVADLPDAWREESKRLLGVIPPTDKEGVLQDTHWSGGSFGYFPTYALGNLYGAQFLNQMSKDIPAWEDQVASGDLSGVASWLREGIHQYGSVIAAEDLCRKLTGENLNPKYFVQYLQKKYRGIYNIS